MSHLIYYCASLVMVCGLFIMISSDNYLRKIIGLGIFQNSVLIFYIAFGKARGGVPPIDQCIEKTIDNCQQIYSNPLPHILMLTAIVVGFSTFAVGLALIYRIYKQYGTISEHDISIEINDTNQIYSAESNVNR